MDSMDTFTRKSIREAQLKGERLICITRLILFIPLVLFMIFVYLKSAAEGGFGIALTEIVYPIEVVGMTAAVLYSFWVLRLIKRDVYYAFIKYLSPFLEITLLSLILNANAAHPREALVITGAPTFIYFVFLVLSTFRNSSSSVYFTGGYITLCYAVLTFSAMNTLHIFKDGGNSFYSKFETFVRLDWDDELLKLLVIILATFLLASLARRFNRTVENQIRASAERERLKQDLMDNVKQISEQLSASGKELTENYAGFSGRIAGLVSATAKIGDETSEEYEIIESTSVNVTEMIKSIETVAANITEQSSLVDETVSAVTQMESSIRTIAATSRNADEITRNLFAAAKDGGEAVGEVCEAISKTGKAGRRIEEILELITGIASTTNLLSMNAAIEAAHAGEAGKGFAVVAEEIRKLAEESNSGANEIGAVLKEILTGIETIMGLSEKATQKLTSILENADQSREINASIRSAMEEELTTIRDVMKSLTELRTLSSEVRDSSMKQSAGNGEVLASVRRLKSQADNVSALIAKQSGDCEEIRTISGTFNSMVDANRSIIGRLEGLIARA